MAEYLDHLDTVPSPRIAILYDEDDVPCGAAAFGDVMANYHKAMGCVAMVTNGVVRDLVGIEAAGMACYAQGLIASHGYFHFLRTGEPVNIHGLTIHQNDFWSGTSTDSCRFRLRWPIGSQGRSSAFVAVKSA